MSKDHKIKKEYELTYEGKERPEKILNDTMSVPFQPVKVFGDVEDKEWVNKLIFGDNLQALKYLLKMKEEGKLQNPDGKNGVKLIYIDPPFASKQDFKGNKGQKAYQDKIAGAEFLEFLRKRLVILSELLTDDGSIYVHLDWRKAHYVKVLMDEIFGENNFRNEVIWCYKSGGTSKNYFARKHANLFLYSKTNNYIFNPIKEKSYMGKGYSTGNKNVTLYNDNDGKGPYTLVNMKDWWKNIGMIATSKGRLYATQKPEKLISKVIKASSNPGDIVLDCFAGSGTTGAVAEKLNRKWIMIDSSKLSIYTIQKRMLNLKEEIGNKGRDLIPDPFILHNAGLYYDGELLKQIKTQEYKDFVLDLFNCQKRAHKINGLQMHGTLNNNSVMVFDRENYLSKDLVREIHNTISDSITDGIYIIAPIGVVAFTEDYINIRDKKYIILRIPNSIIDRIKNKNFKRLLQVRSKKNINKTIDSVGFDFIYPPKVEAQYFNDTLNNKVYHIKIEEFEPVQLGTNIVEFEDTKADSLAMVLIDRDYDGKVFDISNCFFGDEITKNDFKITFTGKIGRKLMIIFIDIFGNEKKEVIKQEEFKNE